MGNGIILSVTTEKSHIRRRILRLLQEHESIGYKEIIDALDADQPTIERAIDDLRASGQIEEHRPGSLKLKE